MAKNACNPDLLDLVLHSPDHGRPHWSEAVDWRPGRWDPMNSAPTRGYPILHVRGRTLDGKIIEDMHYACGDGDGLMPPFDGWFAPEPGGAGFYQVRPVEWQPQRAIPQEEIRG